jgi:methionine synthase II (cobalamin-independent)
MSKLLQAPFRFDVVGSFLRPEALKEARRKYIEQEITAGDLKAVEDIAIKELVQKQKDAGLITATDGEYRRSWWNLDFFWGLQGVKKIVSDENAIFKGIVLRGESAK